MSTDNIVCIQNKDWNFITAVWAWMACRTRTSRSPWCRGTRGKSPATNQTRRINKSFGQQMKRVHQYPRVTNQQSWFPATLHLSSIQAWNLSLDDLIPVNWWTMSAYALNRSVLNLKRSVHTPWRSVYTLERSICTSPEEVRTYCEEVSKYPEEVNAYREDVSILWRATLKRSVCTYPKEVCLYIP